MAEALPTTWDGWVERRRQQEAERARLGRLAARAGEALGAAGFAGGRNHVGGGWSDQGPPPYAPPIAGYLVDVREVEDGAPYPQTRTWVAAVVDHAGKGRRDALPRYTAALAAAGYRVAPRRIAYRSKTVLTVEEAD